MAEPLTLFKADRDTPAGGAGPAAAWCLPMVIALAQARCYPSTLCNVTRHMTQWLPL
jgi:hypothetical protein